MRWNCCSYTYHQPDSLGFFKANEPLMILKESSSPVEEKTIQMLFPSALIHFVGKE